MSTQIDTSLTFGEMDKTQLQMEMLHIVEWLLNEETFQFQIPSKKATEHLKEFVRSGSLPAGDLLKPRLDHWIIEGTLPGFIGMSDFCTQLMNKMKYYSQGPGVEHLQTLNLDGGKEFKSILPQKRGRKFEMNLIQKETPTKKRLQKEKLKVELQKIQEEKLIKAHQIKIALEEGQIEAGQQDLLFDDLLIASIQTSAAKRAQLSAEQQVAQLNEEIQKIKDAAADQAREVEELKADILRLQQGPVDKTKDMHQSLNDILVKCILSNKMPITRGGMAIINLLDIHTPFGLELIDVDIRPVTSFRFLVKLLCYNHNSVAEFYNQENVIASFIPQMLCIIHQMIGCLVKLWTKQLHYDILPKGDYINRKPMGMFLDEEVFVNEIGLMTIREKNHLQTIIKEFKDREHVDRFDYGKQKISDDSYVLLNCLDRMLSYKFITQPYYLKEYVITDMAETFDFSSFLFTVPTEEEDFNSTQATMMNEMFATTHPYAYDMKVRYTWTQEIPDGSGYSISITHATTVCTATNLYCVDDAGLKILEQMDERSKYINGEFISTTFQKRKEAVHENPILDIWYTFGSEVHDVFTGMWPVDAVDINFITAAKEIIQNTCVFIHENPLQLPAAWTFQVVEEPVQQHPWQDEVLDAGLLVAFSDVQMQQLDDDQISQRNQDAELDHLISLVYDASNERDSNSVNAASQQTIQKKEVEDPARIQFLKELKQRHFNFEEFTLPSVALEQILKNEQHRLRNLLIQILGESNSATLSALKKKFQDQLRSESSGITKEELDRIKFSRRRIRDTEELLFGKGSFTYDDLLMFICEQGETPIYYRDMDTTAMLEDHQCKNCSWTVGVFEPHAPHKTVEMQRYKCSNLKCDFYLCWTCLKKVITYDLADLQPNFNECRICGSTLVKKGMGSYHIGDMYDQIRQRITKTVVAYTDMVTAVDKNGKATKPTMTMEEVWEHHVLVEEKDQEENKRIIAEGIAARAAILARRPIKPDELKRQQELKEEEERERRHRRQ